MEIKTKRVKEGNGPAFVIIMGNNTLIIEDIHPGGGWDEVHPMMYKEEDALKVIEYIKPRIEERLKPRIKKLNFHCIKPWT
jgi:hypothetical protein